jgi:predicted PurR-regulated permease PerM
MPPDTPDTESKRIRQFRLIKNRSAEGELLSNIAVGSVAQLVVAVAAVLGICYAAKLPLIILAVSILIAFILAPVSYGLEMLRFPRWAAALTAVALLLGCLYGVVYFSYGRAADFIDDLPKYSNNIREAIQPFRKQAEKLQKTTDAVIPEATEKGTVKVSQQRDVAGWITTTVSGLTEVVVAISFIPFLVYFMLTWKDHARVHTVKLFDEQHRQKVHTTLGDIAGMLRGFLVGNFICGLFMAGVSVLVFGFLQLPYFYFLGFISGFLSLIPYLGVFAATLPPVVAGIGTLTSAQIVMIVVLVVGLHVFAINVLFPKVVGRRLKLNPLVVTLALLMWGWLWGAMGLILALPITGAVKIIFDHVDSLRPLGSWMED